ncbi:hypothetical protein [Iodobacter fluviatilis]|uniref:Uncharacterized protein n=1 Tax=Iodobacter fluviatilis TaxID=537 RepID=A0A377Q7D3_9NEIS|nr:hypothetical protein [Iodobacter fluviatilis]TCU89463.1 hypothetical protein EV682_102375 [Iodobacter fluviatilis]STQ90833.1 Uncharacterised protein [Iodobacter fluviatilis]
MKKWKIFLLAQLLPALSFATTTAAPNNAATTGLGKVIGMALFGYIVMKVMNRNKEENEDRPRGTRKILVGVLALVILAAIFH